MGKKDPCLREVKKINPCWVCNKCGTYFGQPVSYVSTYHVGNCDICKQQLPVTEARDFGIDEVSEMEVING